jgi:hypothetical protein
MTDTDTDTDTDAYPDTYPDTAYRGEPSAPPAPGEAPAETSRVEAKLRQYYLLRQGPQCGEYFALYETVDLLASDPRSDEGQMFQKAGGLVWPSARNPAAILPVVFVVSLGTVAVALVTAFLTWRNGEKLFATQLGDPATAWFSTLTVLIPLLLALISFLLINFWTGMSHRGNSIFRRHEGRFYPVNHSWDEPLDFADFDPYVARSFRGSGDTGLRLMLCHRRETTRLAHPQDAVGTVVPVWLRWELLQHYMDVRWPLPEVPECEPFRPDDPTTAEADERRGRPPHLLGNLSVLQFNALREATTRAANTFPWGKTRAEAKAEGWQPSIYSQLQFGEVSYDDFIEWLNECDPADKDTVRKHELID